MSTSLAGGGVERTVRRRGGRVHDRGTGGRQARNRGRRRAGLRSADRTGRRNRRRWWIAAHPDRPVVQGSADLFGARGWSGAVTVRLGTSSWRPSRRFDWPISQRVAGDYGHQRDRARGHSCGADTRLARAARTPSRRVTCCAARPLPRDLSRSPKRSCSNADRALVGVGGCGVRRSVADDGWDGGGARCERDDPTFRRGRGNRGRRGSASPPSASVR